MEKFKHFQKSSEINNNDKSNSVTMQVNDQLGNANSKQSDVLAIETHICGKCSRSFSKYHGLKKHGKLHKNSRDSGKKFQCDKCPNLFSNSRSLTKHKKKHNDENENAIIQVNSQNSLSDFGDSKDKIAVSDLKNEEIMKSPIVSSIESKQPEILTIETFVCGKCNRSFSDFCRLKKHGKLHNKSSKQKFQCDECPKLFYHNASLSKHKKTHSRKLLENLKYDKSVKIMTLKVNIESLDDSSKKFQCDECPKLFSHDVSLTKHKKIHFHSRKLQVNLKCDTSMEIVDLEEKHNTVHPDKSLKCDTSVEIVDLKEKQNAIDEISKCDGCFKVYSSSEMLQSTCEKCLNMLLQSGKKKARKPFYCYVCTKAFSRPDYLDEHAKKMHTDVKKFSCNQCLKKFSRYNFLEFHIAKRHSGLIKLECDKCPKSFSKLEYLKIHQKVHKDLEDLELKLGLKQLQLP